MLYKLFLIYEERHVSVAPVDPGKFMPHNTRGVSPAKLQCGHKNMHCPVRMSKCNTILQSELRVLSVCTQQSSTQKHFKSLIFVRKIRKIILW